MSHEAHAPAHTDAHGAPAAHDEHPPTSIREYGLIGLGLMAITAVELWVSYSGLAYGTLVAILIVLSAFKFWVVVWMFMHLRFEHGLLTKLFSFGLILGTAMILATTALFWHDATDSVGGIPEAAPGAAAPAKH